MVDARGLAVAPGFINMLSWATESLLVDPRGQSDLRQGVTLEVMGEGWSMGPLTPEMKALALKQQGDFKFPIEWTTLGDYLSYVERKGTALNIASFVGATTVRQHVLGERDVDPNPAQLDRMRALVRQAMEEGAMGVGSSLIYPPASFAETDELVALVTEAGKCGGMYISHMRSEGDRLVESVDELIEISRRSGAPAEIYHLKQAGRANWGKLDQVIARVEAARAAGLGSPPTCTPTPPAGPGSRRRCRRGSRTAASRRCSSGCEIPRRSRGSSARCSSPAPIGKISTSTPAPTASCSPGLVEPSLKPLIGKTIAEIAKMRGVSPEQAVIDLTLADKGRAGRDLFPDERGQCPPPDRDPVDELRLRRAKPRRPKACSSNRRTHPRAYGNFARLLGKYVRDEKTAPLADAIRRLTALPASNLGIRRPRPAGARHGRRRRPVRPRDDRRPRDLRTAACNMRPACATCSSTASRCWPRGEPTGATPGPLRQGPRLDRLARWRSVPRRRTRRIRRSAASAFVPGDHGTATTLSDATRSM